VGGSALCRFLKLVAADGVLSVGGGGPEEGQSGQEVLQGRKNQTVAGRRDIPARPWQHGPAAAVWRGGFTALQHAPPPADLPIPPPHVPTISDKTCPTIRGYPENPCKLPFIVAVRPPTRHGPRRNPSWNPALAGLDESLDTGQGGIPLHTNLKPHESNGMATLD